MGTYNDVTVGDVMADYINFSFLKSSAKKYSFTCSGDRKLNCILGYGEKLNKRNPGWEIFLKFEYDIDKDEVSIDSLRCIQVP